MDQLHNAAHNEAQKLRERAERAETDLADHRRNALQVFWFLAAELVLLIGLSLGEALEIDRWRDAAASASYDAHVAERACHEAAGRLEQDLASSAAGVERKLEWVIDRLREGSSASSLLDP